MTGRLLGIARKARPRAAIETIDRAMVGLQTGIEGDHRGGLKPGGRGRRQVTAMTLADWQAALAELDDPPIAWSDRRANLLVADIDLPRERGALLRVGAVLLEITGECDPCIRMDQVVPGLRAALIPEWRGGRLLRVVAGGAIAVGDAVTIETEIMREAL